MGRPNWKLRRTQGNNRTKNFSTCLKAAGEVKRYLEVGVAEGWSGRWWIEKSLKGNQGEYQGIDIWWDWKKDGLSGEQMRERAVQNLDVEGFDAVNLLDGPCWEYLPKMEKLSFDVIYIDGDHGRIPVLGDSCLAWKLLRVGGVMLWDDYGMRSSGRPVKTSVDAFLKVIEGHWKEVSGISSWQKGVIKTQ